MNLINNKCKPPEEIMTFIDPNTIDLADFQDRPVVASNYTKNKDGSFVRVNYLVKDEDTPESVSSFNSKISYTTGIHKKTKNTNPMANLDEI